MSDDMRPYVVRQGDYLARLAWIHGFDADLVWNDPKNEDLKKLRPDPNLLAPGDVLHIPTKPPEGLPIAKGGSNKYAAKVPKVEVGLVFQDADGTPLANEPCEILGLGLPDAPPAPETTDGDGKLTLKVPVTVREVEVHLPRKNVTHHVRVGDMDPAEEASGVQKRLRNLGLWHEEPDEPGDDEAFLSFGLRVFQAQAGMDVTGALGDDTKKAILDKHKL